MKMFLVLSLGLTAIFLNAQNIQVTDKWQLLGATENISASSFDGKCVDFIWKYSNSWQVYIANDKSYNLPNSITTFDTINKGQGFWIKGHNNCEINITKYTNEKQIFKLKDTNINHKLLPDEKIILNFNDKLKIDDKQPDFGISSSNIENNIYFVNKQTKEKKKIFWGDWFFKQECHTVNNNDNNVKNEGKIVTSGNGYTQEGVSGGSICESNYKGLEIHPIISNEEYQLVIDKGLKSKDGKHLDKTYYYDIEIEHPDEFKIVDNILEVKKNQAKIKYKIFSKYNSQKIIFHIKTSSGVNVKKSLDIGSAAHGGPGGIGFGPCETSINVNSSGGWFIPNTLNYNKFTIYVYNTRDKAIDENIDITICDEDGCSIHKTLKLHLDADPSVDSCRL